MNRLFRLVLIFTLLTITSHATAAPTTLRFLYVNDFHGFANPIKGPGKGATQGGAAWLAQKIKILRSEHPALLLAAGDMIQGENWANFFQGESSIDLMNLIGFDAMVLGNHEFDFGQAILARRISEANFPVIAANVAGISRLNPYVVREIAGLRVGIIGLVTDDIPVTSNPVNSVGLDFFPPLTTAKRFIHELHDKVDLIVLLTHVGHLADRALANELPGNLVIIGGHSHTRVEQPVRINNSVVVQAWEHAKCLGVLDVTVDNGKLAAVSGRLEEIRPTPGGGDPATEKLVQSYNNRVAPLLNELAGTAAVELVATGVRRGETNFGNLVADVVRRTASADAAIINGGAIRTGITQGEVLVRDVYAALPFDSYVVAVGLTGKELRNALEHGVSALDHDSGRFPQVSGLSFTYAPAAPAGSRVRQVEVNGLPLDEKREYRVATLDFLAAGGDGYRVFGDVVRRSPDFSMQGGALRGKNLLFNDPGRWLRDLVVAYLRRAGEVAPTLEGRIREIR